MTQWSRFTSSGTERIANNAPSIAEDGFQQYNPMIMPNREINISDPEGETDQFDTFTMLNSNDDFPFDMDYQDMP
jgi:hypothetical protein